MPQPRCGWGWSAASCPSLSCCPQRQIAQRIAGHAPLAVKAVREVTQAALDETLEQSLRLGSALRWIIGQTEDAREGPRAFAERREPQYQGR